MYRFLFTLHITDKCVWNYKVIPLPYSNGYMWLKLVVLNAGDFGFKGLLSGIGGHDCPFSVDNSWCSRDVDIIKYCLW